MSKNLNMLLETLKENWMQFTATTKKDNIQNKQTDKPV